MPASVPVYACWTDERISETLSPHFVRQQLQPAEQALLDTSPPFGDGLTDDTYFDWILSKAKRLFLVLADIGIPEQIFGLVDESYDDGDLPFSLENVRDLRLSCAGDEALDRKFYKTQFKYMFKDISEGEHVRYVEHERVPVEHVGLKITIGAQTSEDTSKVRLSNDRDKFLSRRRISIGQDAGKPSELEILSEIAAVRRFAHQHVVSCFASYLQGFEVSVLFTPAAECNLKSFVSDAPKQFEALPKIERRQLLINWPHCLASGLTWLHGQGRHHGAIRPSNIFLDNEWRIFLGNFDVSHIMRSTTKSSDLESYQYAAPERWKRAVVTQRTAPIPHMLHSGGRTAHRRPSMKLQAERRGSETSQQQHELEEEQVTYTFQANARGDRLVLVPNVEEPSSHKPQILSSPTSRKNSVPSLASRPSSSAASHSRNHTVASFAPSVRSNQTGSSGNTTRTALPSSTLVAAPEVRTAIVEIWQSAQLDAFPADVFALGAVLLDILTFLCKHSSASFARHRAAKNRTAGRGVAVADASFHANLGQVYKWMDQLTKESDKKTAKDATSTIRAVGPMNEVLKTCLRLEPEDRPGAELVERRINDCIWRYGNITEAHCVRIQSITRPTPLQRSLYSNKSGPPSPKQERKILQPPAASPLPSPSPPKPMEMGLPSPTSDSEPLRKGSSYTMFRSAGLATSTIPRANPQPNSSLDSFTSFNFNSNDEETENFDARSSSGTTSYMDEHVLDPQYSHNRLKLKPSDRKDSEDIDPRLMPRTDTHRSIISSAGYEDEDDDVGLASRSQTSFLLADSRPGSGSHKP